MAHAGLPCCSCGVLTHSNLVEEHVDAVQADGEPAACCRSHIGQSKTGGVSATSRRACAGPWMASTIKFKLSRVVQAGGHCLHLPIAVLSPSERSESSSEGSTIDVANQT
jgi:hypothetical protein